MVWEWNADQGGWQALAGAVPDGWVWHQGTPTVPPAIVYNHPDLSAQLATLGPGGSFDLVGGPNPFPFTTYAGVEYVSYDAAAGPGWRDPLGISGNAPSESYLWVVAYGPGETDDPPSWDPAEALGPPIPPYRVFVVDTAGTLFAGSGPDGEIENARVTRVSWELNGPGAAELTLATTDPDAALLIPGREIQIYLQGGTDPIWWGPIVRPQAALNETSWQCAGLLWYFAHRFMGRADRVNQLTNGSFESSETGWTFNGGVTHSVNTDTTYIVEGTKSEKLTGATADHTSYMSQTWTHPGGGYPGGDFITGSVYAWIPSAAFVGGALDDFGLLLRHRDSAGNIITTEGGPGSALPALIDDDTPKDQWVQLETGVPFVEEGDTVEMLLFPPHGDAYFDLATLTFMESLSFGYPDTPADVTDIIGGIVDYAQDNLVGFTHGKSDLNIGHAGADTSITRQVAYQFTEHRNILDAILEFVRQGAGDINIDITSTTRTFTVYPKVSDARTPKFGKGVLYGTTLELDVNVADFTYAWDLEQAASNVVLLGSGDGPDRPEGGATDASFVGGAFTVEIVEQAPDNTTVGQLDERAAERLAVAARPEILEVTTLPATGIIGALVVGDTVPVIITDGWVNINTTYRVARIEANLPMDQATFTLNAIPEA